MDVKLKRYYIKKICGGRSVFARVFDFILSRAFILMTLFFILLHFSRSLTASLLIAIFLTVASSLVLSLWRLRKIQHCIDKDLYKLKQKSLLEMLTFMEFSEFVIYMQKLFAGIENIARTKFGFSADFNHARICVFQNHPSVHCDIPDILSILRHDKNRQLIFVSLSDFTDAVKTLCKHKDTQAELVDGELLLSMAEKAGVMPDEKMAQQKAEEEMHETVLTYTKLKESALCKRKIKSYVACGILSLLWPLVTGFKFYYPIIAGVCFALAVITYRKAKNEIQSGNAGVLT